MLFNKCLRFPALLFYVFLLFFIPSTGRADYTCFTGYWKVYSPESYGECIKSAPSMITFNASTGLFVIEYSNIGDEKAPCVYVQFKGKQWNVHDDGSITQKTSYTLRTVWVFVTALQGLQSTAIEVEDFNFATLKENACYDCGLAKQAANRKCGGSSMVEWDVFQPFPDCGPITCKVENEKNWGQPCGANNQCCE